MARTADTTGEDCFAGGGEMGARMRAFDWVQTPVGPVERWPHSLQTAVSICLASRFPIVIYWGAEYVTLYNDAYSEILGQKHPWALGRGAREVWAEIWDVIGSMLDGVMATGHATWSDDLLLILGRQGYPEECYFSFSFSPVRVEHGRIGGVFTAVTETTQRVLGERRMRTLRDLAVGTGEAKSGAEACQVAAEILTGNPADLPFALLYLLDAEGGRAQLMGLTRLAPDTLASPRLVELAASEEAPQHWPLGQVAYTAQAAIVPDLAERFGPLPGGPWPESPHTALILPVAASPQSPLAGLLVAGVSPRRACDDDYRSFLALVAGHVAAAITNARAYEAERQRAEALVELDCAKTAFFSNVSHEFRTPLTLMLGPLEQALAGGHGALTPPQREELEVVHRNGLRLLKLVNTLLDFSRIEAGRIQAVHEPTDLAACTAELASVFRSAIERAGLRLVVECPTLPEPVYVDRDMWEKIVLNLLSNAFKFTFEGEIAVNLSWDGEHIALAVRDTGTGIPAHELPHIFERFHRIRNAQARTHEGTGIGLALVQELVRLHGGQITVASAVGVGTTFTVTIPTGTAHLPADRVGATRSLASTALGADAYVEEALRWLPDAPENQRDVEAQFTPALASPFPSTPARARILLADDNADMRAYVQRLLSQRWEVEAVADGLKAWAVACEHVPDLVLADVMMPGLDGFELLRALRADSRTREVPILLLSARAGEEARVDGLEAGADDYLIKPFSARELLARVEAHLTLKRLRDETQATMDEHAARLESVLEELQSREAALREHTAVVETINRVGRTLAAELDLPTLVQTVTDAATALTGAQFGAFFYNVSDAHGESYMLYTLSGTSREQFAPFPMPRNTALFEPTFQGTGVVRIPDVTQDPRYGQNAPHYGLPPGHLPVTSYLAVPVVSRLGEVLGGLFFGHPDVGVFTDRHERIVVGLAAQAAVAMDNARLFAAAQHEIAERKQMEAVLRESEQRYRHLVHALPAAVYTCDAQGRITLYNEAAVALWGRVPEVGKDLWCGSWRIYAPDGTPPAARSVLHGGSHSGRPGHPRAGDGD